MRGRVAGVHGRGREIGEKSEGACGRMLVCAESERGDTGAGASDMNASCFVHACASCSVGVLQCVAVCCSVLQCVAVCCSGVSAQ